MAAGKISPDLVDILVTRAEDDAVSKKRTKMITGSRDLASEKYREMLAEDKKKKLAKKEEEKSEKNAKIRRESKRSLEEEEGVKGPPQ